MSGSIVIVGYARTPFARAGGALQGKAAFELGAFAIDELLRRTGVEPGAVGALYAGAGTSAPRETVLASRLPAATVSLAVERAGCSGLSALGLGWRGLRAGIHEIVICGGSDAVRTLSAVGAATARGDAVADAPRMRGAAAAHDAGADVPHGVSRELQDAWAAESHARYFRAEAEGFFAAERFAVGGLAADDGPRVDATATELARLPPLDGSATLSAGNSPAAADGAAFVMLATSDEAGRLGLPALARLVDHAQAAAEPEAGAWTPALAIRQLMKRQGRALYEIDLLEIDEAPAATPLLSTLRLGSLNPSLAAEIRARTNVHGGAIALGHAPGAGGARLAMTLASALGRRGGGRGVAATGSGNGQSEAVMIEVGDD